MALDASSTDAEVGLFVSALASRLDVEPPGGRDEVVSTLISQDMLINAGGLQLLDTATGVSVVPGCCCGLEDWREWVQVLTGESPFLGHSPSPEVEIVGDELRVWQDGGPDRKHGKWAKTRIVLPKAGLPDLLRGVHQDLVDFLARLNAWTERNGLGENGTVLVAVIDRDFAITAALDLPAD